MFRILNMEFKDRLKTRMDTLGIRATDISERLKVSRATVSFWMNGTNGAKGKNLLALAEMLECLPNWLETGKGPMSRGAPDQPNGSPSGKDYALIPQFSAKADCGAGYLNEHVELTEGLAFKRDWLKRINAKPENLYVIYASGNSMEPYIFEGDVVLFDTSQTEPKDKQVYVIRRPDGGNSIKRLTQQLSGVWVIRSDNPDKNANPDELASEESIHDMPILGRVIWRGGGVG